MLLPVIENTAARLGVLKTTGVEQQPEHREFGVQLAFDQELKIGRQIGGLHQRGVVMQQPKPIAAEQHTPLRIVVGIKAFLQAAMGRSLPSLLAELGTAAIEIVWVEPCRITGTAPSKARALIG